MGKKVYNSPLFYATIYRAGELTSTEVGVPAYSLAPRSAKALSSAKQGKRFMPLV